MAGPRLATTWVVVLFILVVMVTALAASSVTRRADNAMLDAVSTWRAPQPDPDIIIVAIDQPSLSALGRWPWPRSIHAQMIDRLNEAGAKIIVYDILFVEADKEDDSLAHAMDARKNVYLPLLIQMPGSNGQQLDVVAVTPRLSHAAKKVGAAPILYDEDGIVRRAGLATDDAGTLIPHLMELVYRDQHNGAASPLFTNAQKSPKNDGIFFEAYLPLSKADSYVTVPFSAVLAGEVPKGFLNDKIVLVGATALGMGDSYPAPWSAGSLIPGIEIQANLYSGLKSNALIRNVPIPVQILISILPVILLFAGFWYLRPRTAVRLAITVIIGWMVIVALAFFCTGWWIPPTPALIGLLVAYPLWGWRRLEALSNWVGGELGHMKTEIEGVFPLSSRRNNDRVGIEADALGEAIQALKTERRFTRDVLEASPDALIVEDQNGIICYANNASDILFGVSVEGWKTRELAGGKDFVSGDHKLHDNILSVLVTNFDDSSGETHRNIIRLADVTEVRKAQADREAVLQFLSHDMRAPQSAIIALLNSNEGKAIPEELHKRIKRSATQTLELADGFVRLARAQSAPIEDGPFDMADLMREAADTLWSEAKRVNVEIAVRDAPEIFATGDASMLMRALINVIGNSIKYSPSGGKVEVTLLLSNEEGPGWRVHDEGPGFAPNVNKFTPFSIGKSSGVQIDGIGLGLAFVETVADRHGGHLTIKNGHKGGCAVSITIAKDRLLEN